MLQPKDKQIGRLKLKKGKIELGTIIKGQEEAIVLLKEEIKGINIQTLKPEELENRKKLMKKNKR